MEDRMNIVRAACREKKLDIPELKTVEGAVALSKCMDILTGLCGEGTGSDFERAGYGAIRLMNWLENVPTDVFRGDHVGIPAIMERIRTIYDGSFFTEGAGCFPIQETNYLGFTSRSFVAVVTAKWSAWKLPYDFEKVKAMKENGYSFDWYDISGIERHPEVPWCEYLRLFPQKSEALVYETIHAKRRDLLECMKEQNALSDAKILEIMSSKEETREFFRSVWYGDQERAPEISMVENLLAEADRLAAERDVLLQLTAEERSARREEYTRIAEQLSKDREKACLLVSKSPEKFREERELVKRALAHAPRILLSGEWSKDRELYEIAFDRAEQCYVRGRGEDGWWADIASGNKKEEKEIRLNAFKLHYPTDEEKRAFLKAHPTCAIGGGFHAACSKKLREDLALWTDLYAHAVSYKPELPTALKKSQAFLKMCEPVRHISDFEKFFLYETSDDLEFALAQERAKIVLSAIPEALKTHENIYRILEHNTRIDSYGVCRDYDELDIALFSDEEFVVGAAAYSINRKEFFRRVDKSLRKVERVWKAWARPATIMEIWSELPSAVKRSRAFAEHLLEIGTGVSRDGDVFAEMWKNFPDLAEALEDAYGKDLNSYVDANGFPLSEWDKKRRVDHIPDAHLKEIISKKLFGGR